MRLLAQFTKGELRLGRIEAFSDGVFAIIVTLLVLDLKVPVLTNPADVGELWQGLIAQLPRFLSWLISFIIVCKFWLNHHHVLGMARHADYGMVWINSIFLMGQSFIPFPTALIGQYSENALAVSIFGVVFALNTVLFIVLQSYIQRRLLKPELVEQQDPNLFGKIVHRGCFLFGRRRHGVAEHSDSLRDLSDHAVLFYHPAGRLAR